MREEPKPDTGNAVLGVPEATAVGRPSLPEPGRGRGRLFVEPDEPVQAPPPGVSQQGSQNLDGSTFSNCGPVPGSTWTPSVADLEGMMTYYATKMAALHPIYNLVTQQYKAYQTEFAALEVRLADLRAGQMEMKV